MQHFRLALIALALCVASTGIARERHRDAPARADSASQSERAGDYDYFLLALSWSPTYCKTHPDETEQCGRKGYGFIVHGLWPQYENGGGPQRCATDRGVDRQTADAALAFMPSRRLIHHEWGAHGSCSGLTPARYFALIDRAFAALQTPSELKAPRRDLTMTSAQLRDAFKRANPGLDDDMMKLNCSRGDLVEVRVCLDRNLTPRTCGKRLRNACPRDDEFTIPASR